MAFSLPPLAVNPTGWGPPSAIQDDLLPSTLSDLPYLSFSKGERISKAADWTSTSRQTGGRKDHQQGPQGFTFTEADDDDGEFRLVDSRTSNRSKLSTKFRPRGGARGGGSFRTFMPNSGYQAQRQGGSNRGRPQYGRQGGGGGWQQRGGRGGGQQGGYRGQQGGGYGNRRHMGDNRRFDVSIVVNPEWGDPVDLWEFSKLTKMREQVSFPVDPEVLIECGKVGVYNTEFSKTVTPKTEKTLGRTLANDKVFVRPTSSEDAILKKLAAEGAGNVFITDSMLSAIMAMPRSVYSWDLVVTKANGQVWFDRRSSRFEAITVNENAAEPPDNLESEPNTPTRLSAEALSIQNNFWLQVLNKKETHAFDAPNPFASPDNAASMAPMGFRYTRLPVGDQYNVIVRAEVDAVKPDGTAVCIKTLNEYDTKVTGDWRKRIEVQRGGVLATEMKNNMFKIQRWAVQAALAGAESIEVGFVSRQQAKDASFHSILSVQSYSPQEFFGGMNISIDQMWTIFKLVLDCIHAEEDGKYLLYKDPVAHNVKLYKLPPNVPGLTEERPEASGLIALK